MTECYSTTVMVNRQQTAANGISVEIPHNIQSTEFLLTCRLQKKQPQSIALHGQKANTDTEARSKKQEARSKKQEARSKKQEARSKKHLNDSADSLTHFLFKKIAEYQNDISPF